jgi:hypothetical protein
MPKDILEYYKVLEVEPGANAAQVKSAYLGLMEGADPGKYADVPALRVRLEKKRAEIEEAYKAISRLLPGLTTDDDLKPNAHGQNRDFNEMSGKASTEVPMMVTALVLGSAVLFIFALGYNLYRQTLDLPAAPASVMDQDPASSVHAP